MDVDNFIPLKTLLNIFAKEISLPLSYSRWSKQSPLTLSKVQTSSSSFSPLSLFNSSACSPSVSSVLVVVVCNSVKVRAEKIIQNLSRNMISYVEL